MIAVEIVDAGIFDLEENLAAVGQPFGDQVGDDLLLVVDEHLLVDQLVKVDVPRLAVEGDVDAIADSEPIGSMLVAQGKVRNVDVADVNGHIFVNNSAVGLYPLMVIDRDLQQKRLGRSKRLAMIVASARTLARFNHYRLTLTVNDEKARIDTPLLFVGNNDYRLDIGAPGQRESLEDGRLSVFVMRKKTRRGLVAASIRALFNRARPDDMVRLEDVERLRVESRRSHLVISVDGEIESVSGALDYRVRKGVLKVIAP